MKDYTNGLGFILIMFLTLGMPSSQGIEDTELFDCIRGASIVETASVWGADIMSVTFAYPTMGLDNSSAHIKLNSDKKYLLLLVELDDTQVDDK